MQNTCVLDQVAVKIVPWFKAMVPTLLDPKLVTFYHLHLLTLSLFVRTRLFVRIHLCKRECLCLYIRLYVYVCTYAFAYFYVNELEYFYYDIYQRERKCVCVWSFFVVVVKNE